MKQKLGLGLALCAMVALGACNKFGGFARPEENAKLLQGPPIEDIVTPFDEALECLKPRVNRSVTYAVGAVQDQTGRQSFGDQGAGSYFTQGAGEMIQSAMLRAGVTLINRRNMDIPVSEARWGIRALDTQATTNFYISGSISSLDFIPGGGFSAMLSGIGPRYRQNRVLVAADIYMTDARTGVVVGGVPIQKQLVASEMGFGVGRFFGEVLANMDAGMVEREALNFVLRQMLSLATFELISLTMEPRHWLPCRAKLDSTFGELSSTRGAEIERLVMEELERLREKDPRAATILERELAGESIEDIMASLGEPIRRSTAVKPKPAPAPSVSSPPSAPSVSPPPPAPAAGPAASDAPAIPPPPDTALTVGSLPVAVVEGDVYTRVTVEAPPGTDLRWGFLGPNLIVIANGHDGAFDLSNVAADLVSKRVTSFRAGGEGFRRVLQIGVGCRDCGAFGEVTEDGILTIDVAQGEERKPLDLSPSP
jgi:curli biogenesis system outer membrane secretion channel CsgG